MAKAADDTSATSRELIRRTLVSILLYKTSLGLKSASGPPDHSGSSFHQKYSETHGKEACSNGKTE